MDVFTAMALERRMEEANEPSMMDAFTAWLSKEELKKLMHHHSLISCMVLLWNKQSRTVNLWNNISLLPSSKKRMRKWTCWARVFHTWWPCPPSENTRLLKLNRMNWRKWPSSTIWCTQITFGSQCLSLLLKPLRSTTPTEVKEVLRHDQQT